MPVSLLPEDEKYLLALARETISKYPEKVNIDPETVPKSLKEKRGIFVSIYVKDELRGCIGQIVPSGPVFQTVIDCATDSAFFDHRFPSISFNELEDLRVEISVLSEPEQLMYSDPQDLINKLNSDMGVILSKDHQSATFLPQVWEQLPDKEEFLDQLCLKARLKPKAWEESDTRILIYRVEKIKQ